MENYTIKERQEIYEHLLILDCPDLLAALIAQRVDKKYYSGDIKLLNEPLPVFISNNFIWEDTPEGQDFWEKIEAELSNMILRNEATLSDVIESTEREMFDKCVPYSLGDKLEIDGVPCVITGVSTSDADFESPTEADFATDKKSLATIYTGLPIKVDGIIYEPTSFWTKVKLFFGRCGYKV